MGDTWGQDDPDSEIQECTNFPDWGKFEFNKYPAKPWQQLLKGASSRGRDLVSRLLVYESSRRLTAEEVYCCENSLTRTG